MLYPMFALVVVTYVVLSINLMWRIRAVKTKAVSIKYFRVFDGDNIPEKIKAGSNHYSNLLEMPVLFYVVCILEMLLQQVTTPIVVLAWLYVALRIVHAVIHMGYNNVFHRMLAFWGSSTILLIMWLMLLLQFATR